MLKRLQLWLKEPIERCQALWAAPSIPDALWRQTIETHVFLQQLSPAQQLQLRALCAAFLQRKEFTGVQGLVVTDAMAVSIAAQACLLVLHWGPPKKALRWYDDFVSIVLHPGEMLAQRTVTDGAGVVHSYQESLLGEAMEGGPITLSWSALTPDGADTLGANANVVIHEFAHKLDMADSAANGSPPLPAGFMGFKHAQQARHHWAQVWQSAFEQFCDAVVAHTRFGQAAPWLDSYAATDPAEFFAVACEAYWVAPASFAQAHPELLPLLDALFQRTAITPAYAADAT